tara:strand:+ start:6910 stop:8157 length:1248 start_codon:yes stop_codon:yes gene_type:complete
MAFKASSCTNLRDVAAHLQTVDSSCIVGTVAANVAKSDSTFSVSVSTLVFGEEESGSVTFNNTLGRVYQSGEKITGFKNSDTGFYEPDSNYSISVGTANGMAAGGSVASVDVNGNTIAATNYTGRTILTGSTVMVLETPTGLFEVALTTDSALLWKAFASQDAPAAYNHFHTWQPISDLGGTTSSGTVYDPLSLLSDVLTGDTVLFVVDGGDYQVVSTKQGSGASVTCENVKDVWEDVFSVVTTGTSDADACINTLATLFEGAVLDTATNQTPSFQVSGDCGIDVSSTGSGQFDVSVVAGDLAGNGLIASENPASCQLAVKYDDECLKLNGDGELSLNVRKLVEDETYLTATNDCRIGLATETQEYVRGIEGISLEVVGTELKVSLDVEYGSFQAFGTQSTRQETFTGTVTGETC